MFHPCARSIAFELFSFPVGKGRRRPAVTARWAALVLHFGVCTGTARRRGCQEAASVPPDWRADFWELTQLPPPCSSEGREDFSTHRR